MLPGERIWEIILVEKGRAGACFRWWMEGVDGVREGQATDETLRGKVTDSNYGETKRRYSFKRGLIVLSYLSELTCYSVVSSRQLLDTLNRFSSQGGIAEWLVL
jgi:hypothetical protein